MKALAVVGHSDVGKTTLVAMLAKRLAKRGTVSTIKHLTHPPDIEDEGKDTARHRAAGATATYGLTDGGEWFATGSSMTLERVLGRMVPTTDYVIIEGYSDSHIPKIVLGEASVAEPVVTRATNAGAVDLDALVSAMEDFEPYDSEPD